MSMNLLNLEHSTRGSCDELEQRSQTMSSHIEPKGEIGCEKLVSRTKQHTDHSTQPSVTSVQKFSFFTDQGHEEELPDSQGGHRSPNDNKQYYISTQHDSPVFDHLDQGKIRYHEGMLSHVELDTFNVGHQVSPVRQNTYAEERETDNSRQRQEINAKYWLETDQTNPRWFRSIRGPSPYYQSNYEAFNSIFRNNDEDSSECDSYCSTCSSSDSSNCSSSSYSSSTTDWEKRKTWDSSPRRSTVCTLCTNRRRRNDRASVNDRFRYRTRSPSELTPYEFIYYDDRHEFGHHSPFRIKENRSHIDRRYLDRLNCNRPVYWTSSIGMRPIDTSIITGNTYRSKYYDNRKYQGAKVNLIRSYCEASSIPNRSLKNVISTRRYQTNQNMFSNSSRRKNLVSTLSCYEKSVFRSPITEAGKRECDTFNMLKDNFKICDQSDVEDDGPETESVRNWPVDKGPGNTQDGEEDSSDVEDSGYVKATISRNTSVASEAGGDSLIHDHSHLVHSIPVVNLDVYKDCKPIYAKSSNKMTDLQTVSVHSNGNCNECGQIEDSICATRVDGEQTTSLNVSFDADRHCGVVESN